MAILAMKCLKDRSGPVDPLVAGISTRQIAYVKGKQDKDGGFDDLVSTSIAVQVKMQFQATFFVYDTGLADSNSVKFQTLSYIGGECSRNSKSAD